MSKPKFKVGDKVKILDGSKIKNYVGFWASGMKAYIGTTALVDDVSAFGYRLAGNNFVWDERGLELVVEKKEKKPSKNTAIVIYRKGDDTIALDKATGKTAKATCCKDDEYDFYTGAKLALERLTTPERKFKVGDKVVGNDQADRNYSITKKGWVGVVKNILNYPKIEVYGFGLLMGVYVDENHLDLYTKAEEPIKAGDKVKIVDTGEMYPTYNTWVATNIKDAELAAQYAYGVSPFTWGVKFLDDVYVVKEMDRYVAYIQKVHYPRQCFIVGLKGLKKV